MSTAGSSVMLMYVRIVYHISRKLKVVSCVESASRAEAPLLGEEQELQLPVLILLDHLTIIIQKLIDQNFELNQDIRVE